MNVEASLKNIDDGWYFFIDIIGSSNPNLSITCQLEKINKIKGLIAKYLESVGEPAIYKSFTGDGMLIVFLKYEHPLDLSIFIQKNILEFNLLVLEPAKIF